LHRVGRQDDPVEDGNVLEANVHVEDSGAFTMPWDAIQRFRRCVRYLLLLLIINIVVASAARFLVDLFFRIELPRRR
jgi:hypothetical protein